MKRTYVDKYRGRVLPHLTLVVFGIILCLAEPIISTLAAPGDLDPTFSGDGRLVDWTGRANDVAIQPDGKIVVAGSPSTWWEFGSTIARYNDDGSADTAFGDNGKVTPTRYSHFRTVVIQPDQKILVAGTGIDDGGVKFMVVRLNKNGSLDTTFDGDGIVSTRILSDSIAEDMVLQPDGKIVVVGCTNTLYDWPCDNFALARYNPNGSLDSTFGSSGRVTTPIVCCAPLDAVSTLYSVALQADGKIVAAGRVHRSGSPSDFAVVRYNPNGSLDTTFDVDGIATTPMAGGGEFRSVAIQADGKIVAAGGPGSEGASATWTVVRYEPNGSLDTTFDGDGILTTVMGDSAAAYSIAVQPDGKLVTAGEAEFFDQMDFGLVRYNSDGSLDTTFGGGDGQMAFGFPGGLLHDAAYGLALDNAGRAVVVGSSFTADPNNSIFAIARLLLYSPFADFDGDGRSDISVFRPADRTWYLNRSTQGFSATQFGLSPDRIVPADYDGDGKTDIAIFRDGVWWWIKSSDTTVAAVQFGASGDIPVPADYTGDGRDDLAIFRYGEWWTYDLTNANISVLNFGLGTDVPVPADFDGDGIVDQAVFRSGGSQLKGESEWHLNRSKHGYAVVPFGLSTDRPVAGDYDGDAKADLAVYGDGTWQVLRSSGGYTTFQWGLSTDIPVPADYDGDGRTDVAVYRDGTWYVLKSTGGVTIQQFGLANDKPVPAAFITDSKE